MAVNEPKLCQCRQVKFRHTCISCSNFFICWSRTYCAFNIRSWYCFFSIFCRTLSSRISAFLDSHIGTDIRCYCCCCCCCCYYYYYYYYQCSHYSATITAVAMHFTKFKSKTVAQLNTDVHRRNGQRKSAVCVTEKVRLGLPPKCRK